MNIQTVTGAVSPDAITLADAHEHVWIKAADGVDESARIDLHDFERIAAELRDFKAAGGALVVDCQPGGAGRDARMLRELSRQTGVWITATTGAHQGKYYPADHWLWSAGVEDAAAYFIEELTVATRESRGDDEPVRAAVIKIGYEGTIEGQTRVLMQAAAHAAAQTGAVILFHTEQGRNVEALLPFFADHGIPASRLYLCHVDKRPDLGLHRELIQAGALLGYDTFGRPKYNPDSGVWRLIPALVAEGLEGGIAIGLDFAFPANWRAYGGEPGLRFLPTAVIPRLRAESIPEPAIRRMTGQNIAHLLAFI